MARACTDRKRTTTGFSYLSVSVRECPWLVLAVRFSVSFRGFRGKLSL